MTQAETQELIAALRATAKIDTWETSPNPMLYRAASALEHLVAERDAAVGALSKINDIRNSIIGLQTMNWSEHIYPLVAALNEAGVEGLSYGENRKNFGSMLERTNAAEARVKELESQLAARQ